MANGRTRTEKAVPNKPANNANIKYNVPISFAFEENNQRSLHKEILFFSNEILSLSVIYDLVFTSLWEISRGVEKRADKIKKN